MPCANTGRIHPSHYVLKLEVVEADDRVDEAVNVVAGGGGPLEAVTVEHLGGVEVIGLYPKQEYIRVINLALGM